MILLTDLAAVLRKAGCKVVEVAGWQNRSYPGYGAAGFNFPPTHVMVHHTASKTSPQNDIAYMLRGAPNPTPGRPNLAPIGNLLLDRTGTFHVIAAGRAVTNGAGSSRPWNGGVPNDMMNHYAIAIEAANNGIGELWPTAQCDAYVRGVAAMTTAYSIPVNNVRAHHEWSPGRKIDPAGPTPSRPMWGGKTGAASWNMAEFRADVLRALAPTPQPPTNLPIINVEDNMLILNPSKRAYDSRSSGPLKGGVVAKINLKSVVGTARAAMLNMAAVAPTETGYLAAWGEGNRPGTSAVNYVKGQSISNGVVVPIAPDGTIQVWTSAEHHLVIDVQGTWA